MTGITELIEKIRRIPYQEANSEIYLVSGIKDCFASDEEKDEFISSIEEKESVVADDRASYGDWQTPRRLAEEICKRYRNVYGSPQVVIEPTCGCGSFILAALENFQDLKEIHGVEINERYVKQLKQEILLKALLDRRHKFPDIYLYTADFFSFDFTEILGNVEKDCHLALIGNPPWVTSSRQGRFDSKNVPDKKNRDGLRGIEAITGKSNFDISEFIILQLLSLLDGHYGGISFLLKNSVVRNLVSRQKNSPKHIEELKQYNIDAAKEFDVAVEASCFSARIGNTSSCQCGIYDFYNQCHLRDFGWIGESFVADIESYRRNSLFDGVSTYVWRSGIKHDCADVLELEKTEAGLINKLGEKVNVEEDMVYPLIKSSDIAKHKSGEYRKYILIPQHSPGEDTSVLKETHPLVYSYLEKHAMYFDRRKSSIYKGKDRFSIFGVGAYSFKPIKIIVSALYKDFEFSMVSSSDGTPIMIDDTCYQLDFDSYEEASMILSALKSDEIQALLRALAFRDSKRVITKNLLMRIDLKKYCRERGLNTVSSVRMRQPVCRQPSLFE